MKSDSQCFTLSEQARSLWAKSGYDEGWLWLPLFVHMYDSWGVANKLWDTWLPPGTRDVIVRATGGDSDRARRCVCLLAALHDIGKATPAFQTKDVWSKGVGDLCSFVTKLKRAGFPVRGALTRSQNVYHPIGGQVILERYLGDRYGWPWRLARSYACIIGSHHGNPSLSADCDSACDGAFEGMGTSKFHAGTWKKVQDELVEHMIYHAEFGDEDFCYLEKQKTLPAAVANVCVGLIIMADWIASNQNLFPLFSVTEPNPFYDSSSGIDHRTILGQRLEVAWEHLDLVPFWQAQPCGVPSENTFYHERFSFPDGVKLRPIQSTAFNIARTTKDPGLIIIEASMGEGKTEAALAAAEVLAERTGRGGVAVALPTMATTDAMFGRVNRWLKNVPYQGDNAGKSMYLAHGKSQLNEEFQGIMGVSEHTCSAKNMDQDSHEGSPADQVVVSDWMCGRKKGVLANFVDCTIDQVLMGALAMKHLGLRQLALANKVVIIDECHAYDVYMQRYLERVLEWLGFWRTPVILLSATLPKQQRHVMIEAYCTGRKASHGELPKKSDTLSLEDDTSLSYPLISYTSDRARLAKGVASSGRAVDISLNILVDDDTSLVNLLTSSLAEGGYAGIICNTVSRAQHVASLLSRKFGSDVVKLVHSRFTDFDRQQKEKELRSLLGPDPTCACERCSKKLIVIGTQVLEQSLDIDFDLLVTDIAPVDLIMQRLGRLHRHHRGDHNEGRAKNLRKAQCFIRGIEDWTSTGPKFFSGIEYVYARASLIESLAVLGLCSSNASTSLTFPSDIAPNVQRAYYRVDSDNEECLEKQVTMFARANLPGSWHEVYRKACEKRIENEEEKRERAEPCLLTSVTDLCKNRRTLTDLYIKRLRSAVVGTDSDRWQRAVRDTQETVEVLLLCRYEDDVHLFPWMGDASHNVEQGSKVSTAGLPAENIAQVVAQSSVRLPLEMSRSPEKLESLISELEVKCGNLVGAWQSSYWLAGRLVLVLERVSTDCEREEDAEFCTELNEWCVQYSRKGGLMVKRNEKEGAPASI